MGGYNRQQLATDVNLDQAVAGGYAAIETRVRAEATISNRRSQMRGIKYWWQWQATSLGCYNGQLPISILGILLVVGRYRNLTSPTKASQKGCYVQR